MRNSAIISAIGKEKYRIFAVLSVSVLCFQQIAFAKGPTDAEIAKKLKLKPEQEIIRKNGKRYLVTPLTDEDIDHMVRMRERLDKIMAGIPKPDPIHEPSRKTFYNARNLMESGKVDEAIPMFSDYITQFKKESAAAKKEDKAEHDFYLSWGYQNRGYCYLHNKKLTEGVADLSDAIKLRPNYTMNYVNRAKAYRLMGNIKLAQADDAKIMTLPKSTGPYSDQQAPGMSAGSAGVRGVDSSPNFGSPE